MENWKEVLTEAGCRVTAPRCTIMHILSETEVPLSPQEIFEQGQAAHPNLGLVTVYRTLELFEDLKLVYRVHLKENCHGYLTTTPGHRHLLICQQCGRAVEFVGEDDLDGLIARVEAKTGFQVHEHLLQLFGKCPACQDDDA